ncbi:hepatic triacylglycerol lipase [Synchiropus splendidus]|uniref:hepatic triacylglycerol lipase n=1 Tax=Synchiropus splendidus TaxID=270530 RepID=UPI00237D6FC0|nr:hepatic triacylglycerol lipase [Synchiropus splendidus]
MKLTGSAVVLLRVFCCYVIVACVVAGGRKIKGNKDDHGRRMKDDHVISSVFTLFHGGEDTCTLELTQLHSLASCGFNSSNPLIIITHGWSVNGQMESWVMRLASVLKTQLKEVNVVITDWLLLAHDHYTTAVQRTRTVGKDIAHLVQTLEGHYNYPYRNVHLIGYSLGAHISGFAGSYLAGPEKIGRITGLDPAGPLFEGMSASERLSPDDAEFVDAIHTFTHERMGLSVGIKQPVAHYDFYPNGGDFQPGCALRHIYHHISQHGLLGFQQTVKCAHERSVDLFIDSLLHDDKQSTGYGCWSHSAFVKGLCLDCRKNRCNKLGYNIRKVHTGTSRKLYLKTGRQMPYKLFHYQFKIQLVNQTERAKPALTISITGTNEESGDIPISFNEEFYRRKTYTFLITLDRDLGELMMLRMQWEAQPTWTNMWDRVKTMMPWCTQGNSPLLTVGRVSIKAGDTQRRVSFCAMTEEEQQVEVNKSIVFVRCKEETKKKREDK